ncbi:hypothetical protein MauCBS54593_002595 [Microsporum audouinii]
MANYHRWKRPSVSCAHDVSRTRRIGIIFGYAALKPVLIEEGVYNHLCTKDDFDQGARVCYQQELRLNFMFTVSVIASNIFALPSGAILDKYGPRLTSGIGAILLAMGSLLFTSASHFPYDRHLCGYTLMAMGGSAVFISSFHLSNTFPKRSGFILSTLTAAFDISSALFLLFREVHNTNLTLKVLFTIYLAVPSLILASQLFLMPSKPYSTVGELIAHAEDVLAEETEDARLLDGSCLEPAGQFPGYHHIVCKVKTLLEEEDYKNIIDTWTSISGGKTGRAQHTKNQLWGTLHALPASEQISSLWFILLTVFAMGQFLRINYFISTLYVQYEYLLSSPSLARSLNHLFDYLLPLGGLIAAPFVGILLDYATLPVMLLILVTITTIIGIFGCIPNSIFMGYINIVLFTLFRPYFYTAVSDYAAKIFGFQTFGKVYGLIIFAASMGSFLQAPLEMITLKEFGGDPVPVNMLLTAGTILAGGALTLFVWHKSAVYCSLDLPSEVDMESNHNDTVMGRLWISVGRAVEDDSSTDEERNAEQTDLLLHSFDRLDRTLSYGAIPHNA